MVTGPSTRLSASTTAITRPQRGGPQLTKLPSVGLSQTASPGSLHITSSHIASAWPAPITPVFTDPLPGEGIWKRTGPAVEGKPPVLVTTFRPDPTIPKIVAYVAWFDHSLIDLAYYPGRYEPPAASDRGPSMVPEDQRYRLLATFNAGFIYSDGNNGSAVNGHTNEPLTDGNATLVWLQERADRDRQVARRSERAGQRRVGSPEPRADRVERKAQPRTEHQSRQPPVGLHAR